MKTLIIALSFVFGSSFITAPTHRTTEELDYLVELTSTTAVNGNYEWVWKVTNPNPGNGKDGTTLQDLSHWGLISGCLTQADLVSAAWSNDGINWNNMSATIAVDPSQTCYTAPVMKFDHGINGGLPVYFKLVVNKAFSVGTQSAVFKSGRYTGCYVAPIPGMSCDGTGGDVIR